MGDFSKWLAEIEHTGSFYIPPGVSTGSRPASVLSPTVSPPPSSQVSSVGAANDPSSMAKQDLLRIMHDIEGSEIRDVPEFLNSVQNLDEQRTFANDISLLRKTWQDFVKAFGLVFLGEAVEPYPSYAGAKNAKWYFDNVNNTLEKINRALAVWGQNQDIDERRMHSVVTEAFNNFYYNYSRLRSQFRNFIDKRIKDLEAGAMQTMMQTAPRG